FVHKLGKKPVMILSTFYISVGFIGDVQNLSSFHYWPSGLAYNGHVVVETDDINDPRYGLGLISGKILELHSEGCALNHGIKHALPIHIQAIKRFAGKHGCIVHITNGLTDDLKVFSIFELNISRYRELRRFVGKITIA